MNKLALAILLVCCATLLFIPQGAEGSCSCKSSCMPNEYEDGKCNPPRLIPVRCCSSGETSYHSYRNSWWNRRK